jgi:hypothetical protein
MFNLFIGLIIKIMPDREKIFSRGSALGSLSFSHSQGRSGILAKPSRVAFVGWAIGTQPNGGERIEGRE